MRRRQVTGHSRAGGSLRRFARAAAGTISVEFALFAAFLFVPVTLVGWDFGRVGMEIARATSAARAGAQYGMRDSGSALDVAEIQAAAQRDAGTQSPIVVTADFVCICHEDPTVLVDCNTATCGDGRFAPGYLRVSVQTQVDTLLSYPGMANPFPISRMMMVRAPRGLIP